MLGTAAVILLSFISSQTSWESLILTVYPVFTLNAAQGLNIKLNIYLYN